MKITRIETISLAEFPNVVWIQVHTDAGHVGLGETFFGSQAIHAYVHETLAPQMLGQDALRIEQHFAEAHAELRRLQVDRRGNPRRFGLRHRAVGHHGQAAGMPLYQLLGGKCRDRIRAYNTCAGYRYVRAKANWGTNDWGLEKKEGPYEDLEGFLHRADDLAESLLAEGYTGMKIWPFDHAAEATGGNDISTADLKKALQPFEKIRKRVGDKVDIHVELHGLWNLSTAMKIARALEPFEPYWFEDPIRPSNIDALKRFRDSTRIWTTASEMLSTRWSFREVFEKQATSVAMLDVGWCGGLARRRRLRRWPRATSSRSRHTTAPAPYC
jgi:L-alanine-DL-glutamate epimerase-like enolase superfamily enzyme